MTNQGNGKKRTDNKEVATDLESLFRTNYVQLCDYAYSFLGDYVLAEDVTQDIFVNLMENARDSSLVLSRYYLFASVRYRALNVLRHQAVQRRNSKALTEFIEYTMNEPPWDVEEEERKVRKVREALSDLSPQCRAVFTMSCLEGKRYKEIAEEMAISVNTVKFHVVRAYRELRKKLED